MPTKPSLTISLKIDLTATEAAWKKHEARARSLPAKSVNAARVDVTLAAAIALAGVRNLATRREAIAEAFRDPPWAVFDRLPEVCLAAQHADLLHRASEDSSARFNDLIPRMNHLRGLLLDDLAVQVRRGRCAPRVLEDIRAGDNSVRDKANDLNDAAGWYRSHWSEVVGKTSVEADELKEASEIAAEALARLGAAAATPSPTPGEFTSSELRRRAFTLLLSDYEVVRRYGAFVFYDAEGGWERYVPSVWTARRASEATKRAQEKAPAPDDAPKPG